MKLALSGLRPEVHKEIITEVQKLWPVYVSPVLTIFDEEEDTEQMIKEANESVRSILEDLNEFERDNFLGWNILYQQYEKYDKQKYIIYNGSPIDLFVSAMVARSFEKVSDEYIEKVIYYLKRYMKKLDVIYWVPNQEGTDGDLNEVERAFEILYNGIYSQYHLHFRESPYFDASSKCAAFIRFNTTDYIDELKYILDQKGNLIGGEEDSHEIDESVDAQKMLQKNPILLNALLQGEADRKAGQIRLND